MLTMFTMETCNIDIMKELLANVGIRDMREMYCTGHN